MVSAGRMKAWRDGKRSVSAEGAFSYGQRLMNLGIPETSGPIALHAAGHTIELMLLLRQLGMLRDGAAHAVTLYCVLPKMHHRLRSNIERALRSKLRKTSSLKKGSGKSRDLQVEKEDDLPDLDDANVAYPLAVYMKDKSKAFNLYEEAWRRKDERAISIADSSEERAFAWDAADFAINHARTLKKRYGYELLADDTWSLMSWWARWTHPETLVRLSETHLAGYLHDPVSEARAAVKRRK